MVDLLLQQATTSRVMLRSRSGLVLKGGLYRVRLMQRALDNSLEQGEEVLLFLGAPLCLTIEEMERHKLFLVDLPAHDMSGEDITKGGTVGKPGGAWREGGSAQGGRVGMPAGTFKEKGQSQSFW